jgi:hypothetical protein
MYQPSGMGPEKDFNYESELLHKNGIAWLGELGPFDFQNSFKLLRITVSIFKLPIVSSLCWFCLIKASLSFAFCPVKTLPS